jgi:hypothetical protein
MRPGESELEKPRGISENKGRSVGRPGGIHFRINGANIVSF